jgi:type I restriction enzyme S subunit
LNPRFFVYQYISPQFREFINERAVRGATVDRIPLKDFPTYMISLPSLANQNTVVECLDRLREETRRLESLYQQKLVALDALKKALLHQAFSGKL